VAPRLPFIVAGLVTAGVAFGASQSPTKSPNQTFYPIPHTHWEGAVFYSREEYLEMGLSNILSAIRLLEKYPDYKFALDQVAYFKPFIERYPELASEFRKFVKEGRLELVGGMDVMPDDVKPGGELFVRQIQYGQGYVREQFGRNVDAAWLLDTFGHHPQLPQLLKLGGYKSFWFSRGQFGDSTPSEFKWQGIDGSTIPAFWLPGFYGLLYGPPRDQAGFDKFFLDRFRYLEPHVHGPERVGLAGNDVSEPEDYVTPLVRQFNSKPDAPFAIRYSVPSEFAAVVAKRTNTPVLAGDFNPIFQGTYSSRIELKQTTREIEQKLLTVEKLGAISNWLGMPTDDKMVWRAWEPVLFNQTHDLASGVMADHVYTDTVRGYDFAKRLANEMIQARWKDISSKIDTRGSGTTVIAFNPIGASRSEAVEVDLGFGDNAANSLSVVTPDGQPVPSQLVYSEHYSDGSLRRAKLRFLASDVPAMGYKVFSVLHWSSTDGAKEISPSDKSVNSIENEYYKLTFNMNSGEILSLVDKATGTETLAGPANVVARQEDKGDLWELYHTLDGTSYIPATNKQPVPNESNALLSNKESGKPATIVRGPLFSEFRISHPMGSGAFSTSVRLTAGSYRIDIETEIVNNEKHVRYQVLFPTTIKGGVYRQEIPFGSVERPIGVENPAQNWVDYGDGKRGMALLNVGMPGNLVSENGTLMLSLLRSQTLGDYNEGHTSESGYELGIPRRFHYALVPHSGDWNKAIVYRDAQGLVCPMEVFKVEPHAGPLPKVWGMVKIDRATVMLSAVQPGPDNSMLIRVFEASGHQNPGVKITLPVRLRSAIETNLLGDAGAKLKVEGDAVLFDMLPFEIKTIKVKLARP